EEAESPDRGRDPDAPRSRAGAALRRHLADPRRLEVPPRDGLEAAVRLRREPQAPAQALAARGLAPGSRSVMAKERILITGGAGYLGSVMTPYFLGRGHRVTVLDNFLYNQTSLLDCVGHDGLEIVRGDSRDSQTLLPLLKNHDVVIALAAL